MDCQVKGRSRGTRDRTEVVSTPMLGLKNTIRFSSRQAGGTYKNSNLMASRLQYLPRHEMTKAVSLAEQLSIFQ